MQVLTLYPGMPTEIMERDITNRIERWTSQSEGIARQESRSMMGVSIVKDFFRDDIDPNTAFSQVTSLAMSDLYYLPPGTVPPMCMLFDPSAPMPTALLAASSDVLDEKESYDLAYFNVRNNSRAKTQRRHLYRPPLHSRRRRQATHFRRTCGGSPHQFTRRPIYGWPFPTGCECRKPRKIYRPVA